MPGYASDSQLHEIYVTMQKIRSMGNTRPTGSSSLMVQDEILWGSIYHENLGTYEATREFTRGA